nr:uncharacterized protein LOC129452709 [Misgurnus anguillicaudatus]
MSFRSLSFQISGLKPLEKMFHRFLICLLMWRLTGVFGDKVKSVSVMEGDSLTLHTDIKLQRDDQILWRFGYQESLIAKINRAANKISIYDNLDERFRGRLQINDQIGDLTITNITTQHSGFYLSITNAREISFRFIVTVYARLPVPVINRYCPQNPPSSERSSVSKCVLLCSVLNVRDVSLSWYKGNSLLSSISVSDLNIRLYLPLEVEYQDTNTYSCVVKNPLINQTQHLNINDLCQPCSGESQVMYVFIHSLHLCFILFFLSSDSVNSCATTEAVIRLVVSALVGVAAVMAYVVLIYDIRSRRDEQKRRS